jgi:hypothetical protein
VRTTLPIALAALAVAAFGASPMASAGFGEEGFPDLQVSLDGPAGPIPKGQTAEYTAIVTNVGDGPAFPEDEVGLYSYRVGGERPVANPFVSATVSTGAPCRIERFPSSFGDYHSAVCSVDGLAPGESAQIVARAEVNESMDVTAGADKVTTLVDAPPVVTGSAKIKLGGLPDSCARSSFTLKAKAKGAKKVVATLVGPLNAEGKPPAGEVAKNRKLSTAKGSKLKADVDAANLDLAFYEIKVAAKYDGKPKQTASVLFQRC